ncbi:hypothetical protein CE91St41_01380 [Oscillospiraceae bacterium]|nr:hypothetical protein CE91St40_01380 [Oscillospiraceae bacterium]BDF73249.1 hypothetical protein CE91St41_01380 [Oscillospiraceae bacterium]
MEDKALLEAIGQMLAQQKQEIKTELRQELMHDMKVLLDTEVQTKFNLLAEGQEDILRRMPNEDDMDIIDGRLDTLEAVIKKHTREIAELKRAN